MLSLKSIFADKLVDNIGNDPIVTFHLPSSLYFLVNDDNNALFGIILPKTTFYYQLITLIIIQTLMAAIAGIIMYQFIIKQQMEAQAEEQEQVPSSSSNDKRSSMSTSTSGITSINSYLVGFGIVFPFIVYQPLYMIEYLSIQSLALRMLLLSLPIVASLRCLEAMFGFTPKPARKSFKNYIIYSSCLMGIKFDSMKPIKSTPTFLKAQFKKIGRDYMIIMMLVSVLKPRKFAFFDVEVSADSMDHTIFDVLSWRHLLNNYLLTLILSTSLSQSTLGVSLVYNIFYGYETIEVVHNPILKSNSPSDFWGRRWNVLVHNGLKNGIYKPARINFHLPPLFAVLATFIASGIIHEYVNVVLFQHIGNLFKWKNMIFFGWNGLLIGAEYTIGHWTVVQWLSKHLPQSIKTSMVILSALPLAHLFIGDWIEAGYFDHVSVCLPLIERIN